jgi:hypothetical protein
MKRFAILAVAAAMVFGGGVASDAKAYSTTDAWLNCTALSGFKFELPFQGSARASIFAFSVDGGPWQYTSWYYTHNASYYQLTGGRWQAIGFGGTLENYGFQDEAMHTVVAWEYRAWSSSDGWHYLGSCQASSYHGGGGIRFVP